MPAFAKATKVVVESVSLERSQQQVQAVGSAEAIHSVVLYPAVGDRVTAVHFTPGQQVQAGALLLELDSRLQRAALEEAKIRLADAERTLERLQNSFAKGAIPKSERDDALTTRDLAKVALTKASAELEDRQVRAPFAGVMGLTDVEVGDRISAQTAIASIDDITSLYINFNAPEAALTMLRAGAEVSVQPWQQQQAIKAKIAQLDSRIDTDSRTLRVKAEIANPGAQYIPGMSFRVQLSMQGEAYAVVPEAALLWGATGPYVWKSVDNVATRVDVKIAQRLSGRLLVSGALDEGELLIVEGVQRLRPNQSVRFEQTQLADRN
ncbi:efflux RND transporter periplasmic adaptor subunit [Pseudoalteromonas sp. BDTF-M6]|uniref:efflux RND transporter periplasmic adaptor subunit n=1 Tax=Pseudoalteromonas sp. BDTF-M6 TaxID=2796132 RepID=UPI001BAF2990|nr:efflux RND transporter periplasmic adaptor subunit [Pseudoalteromonas sp. BDTF-M6]MBS3796596.1 efflux RND transporter periplasmic adaptor subunit [Pseudoalteromonas sp. BDTF-M6]